MSVPKTVISKEILTTSSIISDGLYNDFNSLNSIVNLNYENITMPYEHFSEVETAVLRSSEPIPLNDDQEEISINGERGLWLNRAESANWKGTLPLNQYPINEDADPEIIKKASHQKVEYVQELAIRYLRPPTPPAPGEIIISKSPNKLTPPAPPIIIRQQPPRPSTPEPLVIREAPPVPPPQVGRKVITISGKKLPPPPRKVIIERLPQIPAKPQSVIVERWLPYPQQRRKVIFNQVNQIDPVALKPKNIIIQWETPQVNVKRDFQYLGIVKANPTEYVKRYGNTLIDSENLPKFVVDIQPPEGVVLASQVKNTNLYELEGDVDALKLVDLEKEGLNEYKNYLNKNASAIEQFQTYTATLISNSKETPAQNTVQISINKPSVVEKLIQSGSTVPVSPSGKSVETSESESIETLIEYLFKSVDTGSNGRISLKEAENLLLKLNSRLDRQFNQKQVKLFFSGVNIGNDGSIDLKDFKRGFSNLISIS
ncbi:unnamed protein product [Brachionus calyciflorus]|uniref:EF-hand domain-containing protein n=1 Tax=Brachionus calyciflorus TaxID=104777 RepID=A0A813XJD5_9BILA|nr:unnamed protein product [Brachionus calyciflorus]